MLKDYFPDCKPMIFHIPHASTRIPKQERDAILLSDEDLSAELVAMTDAYTDDLFGSHAGPADHVVIFPVSRLIVDPERFTDDAAEPMAKIGMGVIYEKTCCGLPLRKPLSKEQRNRLIRQWYDPHHARLESAVQSDLNKYGRAVIIDCHSFPSAPLPYETVQDADRPDICIGTDDFHTPEDFCRIVEKAVIDEGFSCYRNRPFSGSIVPMKFYRADRNVVSIMIEVNRSLVMCERTGRKGERYAEVRERMGNIIKRIEVY